MDMFYSKFFVLLVLLMVLAAPLVALADGMIVPPPNYYTWETDQKAVIFYEAGQETLVLSITFQGNAKDFAWIIPTPSRPEVSKASDELFTSLDELTAPSVNYPRSVTLDWGMGVAKEGQPAVIVLETKKIDYYSITVLEANDAQALSRWLNNNGYKYPESGRYILNDYVENGWYFTAVKIDDEYLRSMIQADELVPPPPTPPNIVRAKCYDSDGGKDYYSKGQVQTDIFEGNDHCRNGMVLLEYYCSGDYFASEMFTCSAGCRDGACVVSHEQLANGHATPLRLDFATEKPVYPLKISSIQTEEVALYRTRYANQRVGILLYVIEGDRQTLPKFETQYAGWIESDKVENLAYDDNGNPWLEPNRGKYFLTRLYRTMDRGEMTSDLYFRKSDDNTTVNAPESSDRGWGGFVIVMIVGGLLLFGLLLVLVIYGMKKE